MFDPIQIGTLLLKNNLIAAPMAGLSSLPYRLLAMEQGCALAYSEMVSAEGMIRANARTRRFFINDPAARPFGVQLFGADPKALSEAARMLEDEPVDLIDINMGCPVRKVCSKGAGSALMKTPKKARDTITAIRAATKRPFTVKIRAGWDSSSVNCVEMAILAEDEGADAVIIHPRTREQMFKGRSDWELIKKVKSSVKIPVIGNGDVKCHDDAVKMLRDTGCDGIMIGRAAIGNPWIFDQILHGDHPPPSPKERGLMALRHFEHLREVLGDKIAILNMRTLLVWYGKGMRGIKNLLQKVHRTKDVNALKKEIEDFFMN